MAQKNANRLLAAALKYADRGWRVLPLTAKQPRIDNWPTRATTDHKTIRRWWRKWPDANIGILTGQSLPLVIDIDRKNAKDGETSLAELEKSLGKLPETFQVKTPNGRHLYFTYPNTRIRNSVGKIGDGLDVRAEGGYVVAPPSAVDDKGYDVSVDFPLAELPDAWVSHLVSTSASSTIVIEEGTRNDTVFAEAVKLHSRNYPLDQAAELLKEFNTRHCLEPLSEEEVMSCLTSAYKYRAGYELNDLGNAQRLLDAAEGRIRFVPEIGSFFLFDDVRWVEDIHGLATTRLLKASNRRIVLEAAGVVEESVRKRMAKFAIQSQNTSRLRSAIENAQSELDVAVHLSELNADPMLLGVQNGVVDLRTGEFRESQQADLITKTCGCKFIEGANCPRWLIFLRQAFSSDRDLIGYVQRLVGYCMTGLTTEQKLFAILGPGASGKSTFLETLTEMLGEYSANVRTESLMAGSRQAGGASEDIARLFGIRFATTTETTEGSRFNQAHIKDLTGGDRVTARFLYQGSFEFIPQFKLLIRGNHRPRFDGDDSGMARRIQLLPFDHPVRPQERDTGLRDKLRAELPGILNWAIDGCLQWQSAGLGEPRAVVKATQDYILEMDVLGQCLAERFQEVDGHVTSFAGIFRTYEDWCAENGHIPKSRTVVAQSLTARGFEGKKKRIDGKPAHVRIGLRIRPRRISKRKNVTA